MKKCEDCFSFNYCETKVKSDTCEYYVEKCKVCGTGLWREQYGYCTHHEMCGNCKRATLEELKRWIAIIEETHCGCDSCNINGDYSKVFDLIEEMQKKSAAMELKAVIECE